MLSTYIFMKNKTCNLLKLLIVSLVIFILYEEIEVWYYLDRNGYELTYRGDYRVLKSKIECSKNISCLIIEEDICAYQISNGFFIAAREEIEFKYPSIIRTGKYEVYVINLNNKHKMLFYDFYTFSHFLKLNNIKSELGIFLQKEVKTEC